MYKINKILEESHIFKYLEKRGLLLQYKKSKLKILMGNFSGVDFKIRQPKKDEIYSFRINRQFRAYGRIISGGILRIYFIDNHQ